MRHILQHLVLGLAVLCVAVVRVMRFHHRWQKGMQVRSSATGLILLHPLLVARERVATVAVNGHKFAHCAFHPHPTVFHDFFEWAVRRSVTSQRRVCLFRFRAHTSWRALAPRVVDVFPQLVKLSTDCSVGELGCLIISYDDNFRHSCAGFLIGHILNVTRWHGQSSRGCTIPGVQEGDLIGGLGSRLVCIRTSSSL